MPTPEQIETAAREIAEWEGRCNNLPPDQPASNYHVGKISDILRKHFGPESPANDWKELAESLDNLCACYRVGQRPTERVLDRISRLRAKLMTGVERTS